MSIFLGGTGSNNELYDYEVGNFTTNLPNGGSYSHQYGRYVKSGGLVFINFYLTSIVPPSNSNVFYIGGLPFTCNGTSHGFGNFAYSGGNGMSAVNLMPIVEVGQSRLYFHRQDGTTAAWNNSQQRNTNYNQPFIIGMFYLTDS